MTTTLNFLFTSWEGGGNVTPAIEAARKLIARGHKVRFMSDDCNRDSAELIGAQFVSWKRAPNRNDRTRHSQTCADYDAATPQEGLMQVIQDLWCGPALLYAQDTIEELEREPADLVVTCELLHGVMAGCESVAQPFATLCPNVSLSPLPGIPPMGPGLSPARSEQDAIMHAQIAEGVEALFNSGLPALNEARARLGLAPLSRLFDQLESAKLELLATSKAFDFEATELPNKVRYVGPQIGIPHWASDWVSPWASEDERPLILVGFSTTFQNHATVLQNIIDALEPLPVRVLLTLGGSIDHGELKPASNCQIVESAPHAVVMQDAMFAITHGGHGTVMHALTNRIPLLVIPHGRDQNDNAVRVTERGAGLRLQPTATVADIRSACQRLLEEEHFHASARRLGDLVAADAENSTVVHELESAALESRLAPSGHR